MNKVGVVAAIGAVALGGLYVGASWLTGQFYDEQQQLQLQLWNQQPGVKAQWQSTDSGLWQRDGVLQLTLAPEWVNQYAPGLSQEPVELFLQVDQSIQPLYIRGSAQLDLSRGSLASALQQTNLKTLPHQLAWQVNALSQGFATQLRIDPWKMQLPEDKVEFALLKLDVSGEINQQADLQLEWDGLSAGNESHQLIYLAPVRANLQLQNMDGAWLSPGYRLNLAGARYISPQQSLILQQLEGDGSLQELSGDSAARLNIHFNSKLQSLAVSGNNANFSIENLALGLNLLDVDKQGYLNLVQSSGHSNLGHSNLGQMQAMAAMQQISSKGLALQLDKLSLDYNKSNLQANGHVTLAADPRPLLGIRPLLARLQAQLDLSAAPELVAQLPNGASLLKPMLSRGYIKQGGDGKLSSQLKLMAGKASANGVALPL